ncbi:MAG TPA: GNAT family N-acetyltransferase [Rhizomicrobium sp.]|nr:GNAT family N-acetyltransferase [Rhizomicrobium sp.]
MSLRGRKAKISELVEDDIRLWSALQRDASLTRTPFLSYGFAQAVQDTRGDTFAVALEDRGKIVGYFPFQYMKHRSLLRVAEKIGGHMSDFFDIVGSANHAFTGAELLRAADLAAFRFDHLPAEFSHFSTGETVSSHGMRVTLQDFSAYAATLAKAQSKFSNAIHRGERQMNADIGDVIFSWQCENRQAELERLINVKREQYARTGVKDALAPPWTRALFHRLLEGETRDVQVVLSTLYAGSTWISTCLCLGYAETLHIWFPVYNADFRRYSPGNVLFLKLFEHGAAAGYRQFDFGEGVAEYKRRFLSDEYKVLQGANRSPSLLGFLDRIAQSAEWRWGSFRRSSSQPS